MKKILTLCILAFLALNLTAQIPTSGLIGLWTFDGNANDQSGFSYNGLVSGALLTSDRFGNSNAAYSFDGTSSYITVADNSALRLYNTDFTISAWVNLVSLDTAATAVISKRTTSLSSGYILNLAGTNSSMPGRVTFNISGGTNPKSVSHSAISLSTWNHIVVLYNLSAQRIRIFLNGIQDLDTTGMPTPSGIATPNIAFGKDAPLNRYYLDGKIDDIAMYNRELTLAEIQQLYTVVMSIKNTASTLPVELFPNPVNDCLHVMNLQRGEIKIYDPLGETVKFATVSEPKFNIDMSELPGGVYFVHITDKSRNTIVKKIIKN